MTPGKLFVVSAPSGAGKTSLVLKALEQLNGRCLVERVVSYTSKTPRPGDVHGFDYFFIPKEEFLVKIEEGFFIEYSTAYGNYYGTPAHIVDNVAQGNSYILVIDRAGAKQIAQKTEHAVLIWIDIPDIETLEKRLVLRKTEDEDQLRTRLLLAQKELLEEKQENFYHYHICNDIFENALGELLSVIVANLEGGRKPTDLKKK
ncbi:MAG: guanylate kinase [Candidatus Babeliales bacterium]